MNNSNKFKIPTLVGLLFIGVLIFVTSTFVNFITQTTTSASYSQEPKKIMISNITESGFTVSWTTQSKATGAIQLSGDTLTNQIIFDERDKNKSMGKYTTHIITTKNLKSNTTYFYTILSNGKLYNNLNSKYSIKTASPLTMYANGLEPAYGTVLNADNTPALGAIVYLTLPNSQTLSSIVRESGSWLIPLNLIRTENLTSYISNQDRLEEQIIVRNEIDDAIATTDTLNDSPVPLMVIGKTYDFRKQQAKFKTEKSVTLEPANNSSKNILGAETNKNRGYKVTIIHPAENATLISNIPLFDGTGVPGNTITLTLGIQHTYTDSAIVDGSGNWKYSPKNPLDVGKQNITITTKDALNKNVALTRSFDILKSGSQVLGDATPSASLTPSIPTLTPTRTLTATPSLRPTLNPTLPPASITPIITTTPTTPVSSTSLPTIILLLIGLIFVSSGVFIVVK